MDYKVHTKGAPAGAPAAVDDEDEGYTIGAENPFAKRYPPDEAEIKYLRIELPVQFEVLIRYYGWTQAEAAEKFGVPQPRISELLHRKYEHFSVETLIRMAARVGIVMRPRLPEGMPDSLPDGWPQPPVPVRRRRAAAPAKKTAAKKTAAKKTTRMAPARARTAGAATPA